MSLLFSRPFVHDTVVRGEGVQARDVQFIYWPLAPSAPGEVRAHLVFWVSWNRGTLRTGPFVAGIGEAHLGENHYSLVVEGEGPAAARVGLRPWRLDDTKASTIWAELFLEGGIDALREFASDMNPGDEVGFWLPEDGRWSDTYGAKGFFDVISEDLGKARTDGAWYSILVSYAGRRVYVMCFSRSGTQSPS